MGDSVRKFFEEMVWYDGEIISIWEGSDGLVYSIKFKDGDTNE